MKNKNNEKNKIQINPQIKAYKDYYYSEMLKYDWNYCTAFHLNGEYQKASETKVKYALSISQSKSFLHKHILSYIKRRILVRDKNNRLKRGIPFYAYYIICKETGDACYHAHILMKIQDEYANHVNNLIKLYTGNVIERLETQKDVRKMIIYMIRKGNLVIYADDDRMIPTPYNVNMNKELFQNSNAIHIF